MSSSRVSDIFAPFAAGGDNRRTAAFDPVIVKISAGLVAGGFGEIASLFANVDEFLDRVGRQVGRSAECLCEDGDLGRVLQGFQPVEGLPQVLAVCDGASWLAIKRAL